MIALATPLLRRPFVSRFTWLCGVLLLVSACDTFNSDAESEAPLLASASAVNNGLVISATFDRPIDPASLSASDFQLISALDNGRTGQSTPASLTYIDGPTPRVDLVMRSPGIGNGTHTLQAENVTAPNSADVTASTTTFDYRFVVQTPRSFIVSAIVVTNFPMTKSNGATWDWDPFASTPRRPDIYVQFQRSAGGGLPLYISNTRSNVTNGRYDFTRPASANDPSIPFTAAYSTDYLLSLVDDDFGGNETMVQAQFKFSSKYKLNNATTDVITVSGNRGFSAELRGTWVY
ncbi:MAG: hypothetical protein AAF730_11555 [Bacteroidota bacterium]